MIIIFTFSADNGSASSSKSELVSRFVTDLADDIFHMGMSSAERTEFAASITLLIRKLAHFSEYALLSILLLIGLSVNEIHKKRAWLWALGITFIYACTDEIHQLFVPGRCGSIVDVGIDFCGGMCGAAIFYMICGLISHIRRKRAD